MADPFEKPRLRDPMPIPTDFEIDGPFPPPIVLPWWVIPAGVIGACFLLGVLLRAKGIL